MICEIINPSDAYTLRTDDFKTAAVAIAVLGRGQMGLKNIDGEESSPVLFGWDDWLKEQGIEDLGKYIDEHTKEMADILATVLIGGKADREEVESALALMPDEEARKKWLDDRHDKRRSSMNNIGAAAWAWARKLRSA